MAIDWQQEYGRYKKIYFEFLPNLAKKPATKISLELLLFLAMIVFFSLFAIKPTINTIISLVAEIKNKQKINQQLEQKIIALEQAQINVTNAQALIPYLNKALPEEASFERLERELEFLAARNKVILYDARFDKFALVDQAAKEATTSSQVEIPFNFALTVAGSFQMLKNFLADLGNLDRLVIIDKVAFSKQSQVPGAALQFEMNGKAFFFPEKE